MRLYHTTTAERAASIMLDGFRDNATVNKRLFSGTRTYPPGVWFGDVPALDDEPFDGIGLFNFDAERQTFIAVDVCLPAFIADDDPLSFYGIRSSAQDDTWPGTQYWAPSSVWNRFPRMHFLLDDMIRLRLSAKPALTPSDKDRQRSMREWIKAQDPRPYGTEFHARVKRILGEARAR
jgi:hypothetical protein